MKKSESQAGAKKEKKKDAEGIILEVVIPEGVSVSLDGGSVKVKGKHGETTKNLSNPDVSIKVEGGKVILSSNSGPRPKQAMLGTIRGHIQNMIHGVSRGVAYKMKIVYSHFPMNVKVQGSQLLISNFLGERHPRKAVILEGVKVDVKGQDVVVTGHDKEKVSQTAANIEQTTKIRDRDARVFQDGIYIVEKNGVPVV